MFPAHLAARLFYADAAPDCFTRRLDRGCLRVRQRQEPGYPSTGGCLPTIVTKRFSELGACRSSPWAEGGGTAWRGVQILHAPERPAGHLWRRPDQTRFILRLLARVQAEGQWSRRDGRLGAHREGV